MTNHEIADVFDQVADLLEFQGANPFRVRAYRNGARRIRDLTEPAIGIVEDDERSLTDLEGIGKDLAQKIETLLATGKLPQLEELKAAVPNSVLALLRIPGLGSKKAAALFHELKITTLEGLRAACEAGQVRALKGFGKKTEESILAGIDLAAHAGDRIYWAEADALVHELIAHLRSADGVRQIEVAGSYRRGRETVGDLDVLIEAKDGAAAMDRLAAFGAVAEVVARGDTKMSVRLRTGLAVDLRVVPQESFGAALQYFTGSKDHNIVLRGMAIKRGLKISEWGVFRARTQDDETKEEYVAGKTEKEVYAALDLPCFPPEVREAREEFEWAKAGELPKLIELDDLRGDLHMHTIDSDGQGTIEEMIAAARARGLEYIAITDHSKRVSMANGLDGARLRAQWKEIARINKRLDGFTVVKGVECDILERGGMDLPDDVLAEADFVIASVHYGQNQSRQQITERMLEAIENPHIRLIAHPTGRLINRRKAYDVDLEQVMRAAKAHGKMLELNANPARLDLNDVACAAAKRLRIPIVINSDAHSENGIGVLRYGILQARRGGLTAKDVANTLPWEKLQKLLK
jgi:DNA polymerase (family 10)